MGDEVRSGHQQPRRRRRRGRWARAALVLLVAAYVATVPTGWLADRVVLGRPGAVTDLNGAVPRMIVEPDGRRIAVGVARSPAAASGREPAAFVLFLSGKGDRADRWAPAVAAGSWGDKPVEVWGVNYPGFGGTDGPAALDRVVPDALAAYDLVRRVAGDGRPIYIHAGSFGTTAALAVAARRPVAGLVLQNPPPLRQVILGKYGWWNLWLVAWPVSRQVPPELDSLANAAGVTVPAVFIRSGADEVIPPAYQSQVIDAYAGPKRVIEVPNAVHNAPLPREAGEQLVREIEWMWQERWERGGDRPHQRGAPQSEQ